MDKEHVQTAIVELQKQPKRKFTQSYDLIINLKNFDVKVHPIDFSVSLPHSKGKPIKIACFVDPQLAEQAGKYSDLVIKETEFESYKDKKKLKDLARSYDYFISQANLMPKVATIFGKALGTKGKMPNPKMGCVVPPNANLEPLAKRLRSTVRLIAKKWTNLQCTIGLESQPEEQIAANVLAVYTATLKQVPNEHQNIKNCLLKLSMSKPVKI